MKSFFSKIIIENRIVLFDLKRSEGKTYYSIYALLSYLSKLDKINNKINNLEVFFFSCSVRNIIHDLNSFNNILRNKFKNEIHSSGGSVKKSHIIIKFSNGNECKIRFVNDKIHGVNPDVVLFDEFFQFKNQRELVEFYVPRSKIIMNGTSPVYQKKLWKMKVFNSMHEFDKRLSLNMKLKKIKNL